MTAICQNTLPDAPWMEERTRRLPGVQPLAEQDWITVDDAYAAQMAERAGILAAHHEDVVKTTEGSSAAQSELYQMILSHLAQRSDFDVAPTQVTRPDGKYVTLAPVRPLETLCHLVSEDFCILEKHGDEHVMTAALLCFPASWTLSQKIGQPLSRIHGPVDSYDDNIARRVQRLFDAVQVGKPLWRANAMLYVDPALYQPRPEDAPRTEREEGRFMRSEKQCILRLPETQAVVFSIHTRQILRDDLAPEQARALLAHPLEHEVSGL